jgi:hypothetical protein
MEAGASRFGGAKAALLDTEKQLETTDQISAAQWLRNQETPEDSWQKRVRLHEELVSTLSRIMDRHSAAPMDAPSAVWMEAYTHERQRKEGENSIDAFERSHAWAKEHKAPRALSSLLRWQRVYGQVRDCQKEWIAYKVECCSERTRPVAVPIGCNHRLCPFCARRRSELARERLKVMYDRLTHPQFLTLTIPNQGEITKHDFHLFRKRVRQLLKQYKGYVLGGVLSLETTYNRTTKTWHIHAHVLFDAPVSLPRSTWAIELNGHKELAFGLLKKRMEFDWLRLWTSDWYKAPRKSRSHHGRQKSIEGERFIFESWLALGWENKTHQRDRKTGMQLLIPGLTPDEFTRRTEWNRRNRRVVDLRPIVDRDKAVKEVLKYITKVSQFSDLPEALEAFADATRGARLIQTFGSWYGVDLKLDERFDTEHPDDWSKRKCACGLNMWTRIAGTFFSHDVEMDSTGQWHLNRSHWTEHCRSTVSRPTIRALSRSPGKEDFDGRTDTYDTDHAEA